MRGRWHQEPDPGWVTLHRVFKIACCDCGLVHTWRLGKKRGVYGFRVKRDARATAQMRRRKGKDAHS